MPKSNHRKFPPGPRGLQYLGVLFKLWRDPLRLVVDVAHQYGSLVHFRIGSQRLYLVNHPDYIRHILQDSHRKYRRGTMGSKLNSLVSPVLGQGLLVSEGELWRRQRRLIQPALHRQRIGSLTGKMTNSIAKMLDGWQAFAQSEKPIDIAKEMRRLSLNIVCDTLFSYDISDDTDEIIHATEVLIELFTRQWRYISFRQSPELPTSENRRFQQALKTLDNVVYRIIDEHRRNEPTDDLLSTLILSRDAETGEGMSEKELRDHVITLMIAGHDTLAPPLAWIWYLLDRHPRVERKLHEELATVLNGRTPGVEDLPNLTYTRMVAEETLRLYSPGWLIFRTAIEDDEIGGYDIPAKSQMLISPYVMGRLTAFWEDPERFEPERFEPERSEDRPRLAHIPFGAGPRICAGSHFAMMEIKLITAQVAQKFRPELVSPDPVQIQPIFTLRPKQPILVTLRSHSPE